MLAWLVKTRIGRALAGLGAFLVALVVAYAKGRTEGAQKAEMTKLRKAVKAHEIRNEVENRIASERDARERLRDDWQQ